MTRNITYPDVLVPRTAVLGKNVELGRGTILHPKIVFEDDVIVRAGVIFAEGEKTQTIIRSATVIGEGAVIGSGIELGRASRVQPGSVVLSSIPANAIVAGNPAQVIGYTTEVEGQSELTAADFVAAESGSGGRKETEIHRIGVGEAALYFMPQFSDIRGALSVGEFDSSFPFTPRRYFINYGVPSEKLRGEHAHKACHQFLICASGSCRALLDNGSSRKEILLDRPDKGLYMPPMIWGTQYQYTHDAVLLVFASHIYDADDYIRTYDEFQDLIGAKH